MATAVTDTKCGYCCQSVENMIDPKELPCGHINCRTCMEDGYKEKNGVVCPHCK